MFSLAVLYQWLMVELMYHGHWFRSGCEQESRCERVSFRYVPLRVPLPGTRSGCFRTITSP